MEDHIHNLEAMFSKAESEVKFLSNCLERKMDADKGDASQHNPMKVMKDVEACKSQFANLKQEMADIQSTQKETVDFLRSQLTTLADLVQNIEIQSGQQDPEALEPSIAMFEELASLMGLPADSLIGASSASSEPNSEEAVSYTGAEVLASVSTAASVENVEPETASSFEPCAAERRAEGEDFVPVTKEEFLSVSNLVRGRATLDDVNKTYNALWEFFKENDDTKELTPKEMNAMGLRVTGATGEAKLKTLRYLKILKISKTGSVALT